MHIPSDSLMEGHLGVKKTTSRILNDFYWPGIRANVYYGLLDGKQKRVTKGRRTVALKFFRDVNGNLTERMMEKLTPHAQTAFYLNHSYTYYAVAHKHFTNRRDSVPIAFCAYFEREFCLLPDDLGVLRDVCAMSLAPRASVSDANGSRQETAKTQFMCFSGSLAAWFTSCINYRLREPFIGTTHD